MMNSPVIDSHVHHYPEEIHLDPLGYFQSVGENARAGLFNSPLQDLRTTDELLHDMDLAGVEKVVLQGMYWERLETCQWQNDFYAECVRAHPDRFIAFASVQPLSGQAGLAALKEAMDKGLRGVGEVFPKAQGFSMDDSIWLQMLEGISDAQLPVCMHITEPAGHDYIGRIDTPLFEYQRLAEQFPDVKFIFAHWGGGLPFFELNKFSQKALRNVYYDTAASPLLYDFKIYETVVNLVGADKVIFGSDYPLRTFPKKQKHASFLEPIGEVQLSSVSSQDQQKILYSNADTLLKAYKA